MRNVSVATRTELVTAVSERDRSADRRSKGRVHDEFVAVTGFHRKYAMRLLRTGRPVTVAGVRLERRDYDEAARTALIVLWEAADRLCGTRLRPLIAILLEAMERHGRRDLASAAAAELQNLSLPGQRKRVGAVDHRFALSMPALVAHRLKMDLQRQLTDLGVQRLHIRSHLRRPRRRANHSGRALKRLRLPGRDLVRMHVKLLRQVRQRLLALQRRNHQLRLEGRQMGPSRSLRQRRS
jgi:hypothetical protein